MNHSYGAACFRLSYADSTGKIDTHRQRRRRLAEEGSAILVLQQGKGTVADAAECCVWGGMHSIVLSRMVTRLRLRGSYACVQ